MTAFSDIVELLTSNLRDAGIEVTDGVAASNDIARVTFAGVMKDDGWWRSEVRVDYVHDTEPERADPILVERRMHQVIRVLERTDCLVISRIENPQVDRSGNLVTAYEAIAYITHEND